MARQGAALVLALFLLPVLVCTAAGQERRRDCGKPCRQHPQLVGACFTLRGRLSFYNGAPSVRIWRVGSRRILGVSEQRFAVAGYCNLPPAIAGRLSWDADLFADLVVCPFTHEQPGVMQLVCVDAAANVVIRPRPSTR